MSSKSNTRPLTLAFPETVFRRLRSWCVSSDQTMSSMVCDAVAAKIATVPQELAALLPAGAATEEVAS